MYNSESKVVEYETSNLEISSKNIKKESDYFSDEFIQKCPPDKFLYNILNMKNCSKNKINYEEIFFENKYNKRIKLTEEFNISKVLGEGSFGLVLQVYDKQNKKNAALKITRKLNNSDEENEVLNQKGVCNPNLVEFYRYFENKEYFFLVMELMEGGTLRDLIIERYNRKEYFFTEQECATIMKGIISGIDYLHDSCMIHRDIKPGNLSN